MARFDPDVVHTMSLNGPNILSIDPLTIRIARSRDNTLPIKKYPSRLDLPGDETWPFPQRLHASATVGFTSITLTNRFGFGELASQPKVFVDPAMKPSTSTPYLPSSCTGSQRLLDCVPLFQHNWRNKQFRTLQNQKKEK